MLNKLGGRWVEDARGGNGEREDIRPPPPPHSLSNQAVGNLMHRAGGSK